MLKKIRHACALSEEGAKVLVKASIVSALSDISFMMPVGVLFSLINLLMQGVFPMTQLPFFLLGTIACIAFILVTAHIKYNATYFTTYKESGVRRITIAEKLRKIPLSFFSKKDLSDLTSTIMADCSHLEQMFSHYIPSLLGSIVSTLLISVSLLFINWKMAIAVIWVIPVSNIIVLLAIKLQDYLGRKQMDAKMSCADGIQECLETVRDLKANNAEKAYLIGLYKKFDAVEHRAIVSEAGTAAAVVSAQLILKIGIATTALAGSILLLSGDIDLIMFLMFLLVASRIYDPLQGALQNLAAMISCRTNIRRMNEIFDHDVQEGDTKLTNQGFDIDFENVSFSYNNADTVLDGVSFTAKQGEITALIGPSGGGKTTATRLASRFWDASGGKILLGGMDIAKIDPETLVSLYSIVFQEVVLFNNSIMENIRIGRKDASDAEVLQAAKFANCDVFANHLPNGYNTLIGENGNTLSGGERQRISIARAFLKDAPIILLDEATASLDVENETLIQGALSRLIKDKTVIVIAHRMRTISGADKIVVLKDGAVAEEGTPAQLLEKGGIYHHMVQLQTESQNWTI